MRRALQGFAFAMPIALWLALAWPLSSAAAAPVLPSGFRDTVLPFEGLQAGQGIEEPTAFRFAPDGKVFVGEKSGKILVYDSLSDHTPTLFADLRTEVYNANDRGLLGLALDPKFDQGRPYVYVLYAYDHQLGEAAPPPRWGNPGEDGDGCPEPPGANTDGCVISGRLSRLTANLATNKSTEEKPLVTDWCQQFSSHSVGDLQFDPEGNLWASGGEGASFSKVDWGQWGEPVNPCGDPPAGVGGLEQPPTAEGGALRSQNPQKLGGKLIRVDPDTGEGVEANPFAASLNANERRIVGKGFRNPFRFTFAPGTNEVYVDNVGSSVDEEIDRFSPSSNTVFNSGWPCYEGPARRELYESRGLAVCDQLYDNPESTAQPFFYYSHSAGVTPEDQCPYEPGSAISGLAFYEGGTYPAAYDGALVFADAVRGCIYVMRTGEDGRPDPSTVEPFLTEGGLYPGVDIEVGPGGDLYYASLFGPEFGPGAIHRISYDSEAPQARLKSDRVSGPTLPLEVHFDAGESTDPQGQALEYEWDLDGNGTFSAPTTESTATESYGTAENRTAAVRVVDPDGHKSVAQLTIYPGDTPPRPQIEEPSDGLRWGVGQSIPFKGTAEDGAGEPLASSHLYWRARLYHCPGGPESCHAHPLEVFPAVESGDLIAPDHDLPSHIELTLTATDSRGLSASETVNLYPNVSFLGIRSNPPGVTISAGLQTESTPFGVEAIENSEVEVSAPATVEIGGETYTWQKWSDGGARVHAIVAQPGAHNYFAEYAGPEEGPGKEPGEESSGGGGKTPQPPSAPLAPQGSSPPSPPLVTIGSHPGKRTHSVRARYSFSADQPASSFRCKLDRGSFKSCSSPLVYRGLRPGTHVFRVVASGPGGQGPAAKFSWKVLPQKKQR
jgi:glucose/arabinose dehydrogenase